MTAAAEAGLAALADKQAIANLLSAHSIAIDNADEAALRATYTADGAVAYGFFAGPADRFAAIVTAPKRGQLRSLHRTSNVWVRLDGDEARSESYVVACNSGLQDGVPVQRIIAGRYLDRLRRTGGDWRIAHRTYVMDWNLNRSGAAALPAVTAALPGAPLAGAAPGTIRPPDDLLAVQNLRELCLAWCRAMDRADQALMDSLWPSAADAPAVVSADSCTVHALSSERFVLSADGRAAQGTASLLVLRTGADGTERVDQVRCTDRYRREAGCWRLATRQMQPEVSFAGPSTAQFGRGIYEKLTLNGRRDRTDPVHAFWHAPA